MKRRIVRMDNSEFIIIVLCALFLGMILGNIWGSSAVRKTVHLGIDKEVNRIELRIGEVEKLLNETIDKNGLVIAKEKFRSVRHETQ